MQCLRFAHVKTTSFVRSLSPFLYPGFAGFEDDPCIAEQITEPTSIAFMSIEDSMSHYGVEGEPARMVTCVPFLVTSSSSWLDLNDLLDKEFHGHIASCMRLWDIVTTIASRYLRCDIFAHDSTMTG
ncbi:hypothetical protein An03g01340 [Aspergillus niger]|uniref:Uncharacterized protein n=2 Tax=Aspergillus niger TaxID=5061 RepID=A2QFZ7_ASPNC|nr:hypothetical protein An03g01340 [Aspergillus niger]CAK38107.1 hypothetical protein An03g01340 [Aspergillus niger]